MIPQIEPWLNTGEIKELTKVIKSTWISEGKKTEEFAKRLSLLTKAKYVLPVTSGTVSLYLSLLALGIKPGDEVIVPDFTFVASSNSVIMAGGKPVFVDVDDDFFNLNPRKIEEKITKKTFAILPVHIYGQAAAMDEIVKIAKKHKLFVLEDAAQGIGVWYKGKHVGTIGDLGIISFYANKPITTGEGGVILTNNKNLYRKAYSLAHEGRKKGDYISYEVGFNFCFTEMQAAVGLTQLKKLPEILKRKKKNWQLYKKYLKGINQVRLTEIFPDSTSNFWMVNILVSNPEKLVSYLKKFNIGTRRFFPPLHIQPCYQNFKVKGNFKNSVFAYKHGLSLPSSTLLKEEEIKYVCQKIKEFFR